MSEKTGFFRSLFQCLNDMEDFAIIPILIVMMFLAILSMPFVENVSYGEIVVCESRFGRGKKVWRGGLDDSWHWQGLGQVSEYHEEARRNFRKEIQVDGTRYIVRGTVRFQLLGNDAKILALHQTYRSEDAIAERLVLPAVYAAIDQAVVDPTWTSLEGGFVERKLKGGLEYALKRVSPTGSIWMAPEARERLESYLNARLAQDRSDHSMPIVIELGLVTER